MLLVTRRYAYVIFFTAYQYLTHKNAFFNNNDKKQKTELASAMDLGIHFFSFCRRVKMNTAGLKASSRASGDSLDTAAQLISQK